MRGRAVLVYSFIFGQSLLFLGEAPRKRTSLIAACTDVLTDVSLDRDFIRGLREIEWAIFWLKA